MTGKMFKTCAIGAALVGLLALTNLNAQAAVTYRTVALTGEAAPGTPTGVMYRSFHAPALNDAGQIAYRGFLTGTGVNSTNNTGLWSEGSGSLGLVAREGDSAPGTAPNILYRMLTGHPVFLGENQIAFFSNLIGPGINIANEIGIWSEDSGTVILVARAGDAAPDTATGVVFHDFTDLAFNDAGQTAFLGNLTGAGVDFTNNEGIWSEGSGSLGLVARIGDAAPDTGPGVVYGILRSPVLNGAGQIAFTASISGPGLPWTPLIPNIGIWSEGSGSLGLVARTGDAAPGTGVMFRGMGNPVLNDIGQTAFVGHLIGPDVNATNNTGIWSEGSGSLELVAREGEAAPGTTAGVVYNFFNTDFPNLVLNGAGQTAFIGCLTGPGVERTSECGIWSEGSGSLALVARMGDAAPGTAPGVVYGNFVNVNPLLNGAGQTAFLGNLTGAGVDVTNDLGIWATDLDGQLTLIAREGDLFDINDDPLIEDLRTIRSIWLVTGSGGEDGRRTSFNDAGQLAFTLDFTDGSDGIFVATIPEPGAFAVFVVGAGLILGKRSTNLL